MEPLDPPSPDLRIVAPHSSVVLDHIPEALQRHDQWVVWRKGYRGGKPTKIPFSPRTAGLASSTAATSWSSFGEAVAVLSHYDGIGFVLTERDPIVGVDLDKCIHNGVPEPWALAIVTELNSYSEQSPSGRGIRIFARGKLPQGGRRKRRIEVYDHARFLTVTGWRLEGVPSTIEERSDEIAEFHARIFGAKPRALARSGRPVAWVEEDDDSLVERALASRDGDVFRRLWTGDLSVAGGDHSRADLMLTNRLVFWTRGDPERVDRLLRRSALFRNKWDRRHFADGRTYGQATIARAIAGLPGMRRRHR